MNAITERAMHDPVAPDEVEDAAGRLRCHHCGTPPQQAERSDGVAFRSPGDVIRFYFDGIHDHDTLLDMVRAEQAAGWSVGNNEYPAAF